MIQLLSWMLWNLSIACTDMQMILPTLVYYVQSTIFVAVVSIYSMILLVCHPTQVLQLTEPDALSEGVVVVDPGSTVNVLRVLASLPVTTIVHTRVLVPETDCETIIKYLIVVLSGGFIAVKNTSRLNTLKNQLQYHHAKMHAARSLLVCCKSDSLKEHLERAIGTDSVTHLQIKKSTVAAVDVKWNLSSIEEVFKTHTDKPEEHVD